jgi:hypothetical protein
MVRSVVAFVALRTAIVVSALGFAYGTHCDAADLDSFSVNQSAPASRPNSILMFAGRIGKNMQDGQQALGGLHQSIEASLQLAAHAETWEWKEVDATAASAATS